MSPIFAPANTLWTYALRGDVGHAARRLNLKRSVRISTLVLTAYAILDAVPGKNPPPSRGSEYQTNG